MAGIPIFKCSEQLINNWWTPIEEAGYSVERNDIGGTVRHLTAKVEIRLVKENHLMLVFSAPFVFLGENLTLAKAIERVLLLFGAEAVNGEHPK